MLYPVGGPPPNRTRPARPLAELDGLEFRHG
jgi:hypothetical protein